MLSQQQQNTPDSGISSIEDGQTNDLLVENLGLKSYIEAMNAECMELNAALFEEANRRITVARQKQSAVEIRNQELQTENQTLKEEAAALKEMVANLSPSTPVESPKKARNSIFSLQNVRASFSRNQQSPLISPTSYSTNFLPRPDASPTIGGIGDGDRPVLPPSLGLNPQTMLVALTEEVHNRDPIVKGGLFKEFVDWHSSGCPLDLPDMLLPSASSERSSRHQSIKRSRNRPSASRRPLRSDHIVIQSDSSSSSPDSASDDSARESDGSDVDLRSYRPRTLAIRKTLSIDSGRFTGPTDLTVHDFVRDLCQLDVNPALDFADLHIKRAIYDALNSPSIEMIPMKVLKQRDLGGSGHRQCPLLPQYGAEYRLKIKTSSSDFDHVTAYISTSARNRIAAVVNLFHYLRTIRTIVTTSTSTRAMSVVGPPGSSNSQSRFTSSNLNLAQTPQPQPIASGGWTRAARSVSTSDLRSTSRLEAMFWRIQRARLVITMTRLGFGLIVA